MSRSLIKKLSQTPKVACQFHVKDMKKTLKCFIGNYDGIRQGMVIANSQERLREALDCSQHEVSMNWAVGKWPNFEPKPFTLYTRLYSGLIVGEWHEGVCGQ